MRIAAVETVLVDGGRRNWVFVRLTTDDGLDGLGEATLEGRAEAAAACVRELERTLVGADPSRIQHLWQAVYRHAFYRGGPAMMSALSGVEQALWDLKGKALGVPVYELLGGACRDRVRVYANGPRGSTPAEYAASARSICAAGFGAMKVAPLEATLPVDHPAGIKRAADCVRAIREAVGPDVALGVDVHGRLSPQMSIQFAHLIAHVALTAPNFIALEWVFDDVPWRNQLLREPLSIRDGWLELAGRPGLGVELDLDVCRGHPYNPVSLGTFWQEDGAVADW